MKPKTRLEWFLAKIAGDSDATGSLTPRTRREYYLKEIADNSGGSGGYDIVVSTDTADSDSVSDYTVAWDYPAVLAKVRAGELVTGVFVHHYNYDDMIDGDTNLMLIPLTSIDIYSESGRMFFSYVRPNSDFSSTTFAIRGRMVNFLFDPETGEITRVDTQESDTTVS